MTELNIIVLIKQVPDPNLVTISDDGYLQRENVPSMADPFGMMALQHALCLKKKINAKITAVSMGPPKAEEMLKRCLEYGADEAILLTDKAFAGADTLATARTLGCFLKGQKYDYIFCGMQATDGDTAQVPPELSSVLGINLYSYVSEIDTTNDFNMTQIYEKEVTIIKGTSPAVVSFIRPPKEKIVLPSMTDFVDARNKEVTVMNAWMLGMPIDLIGIKGSKTRVDSIVTVIKKKKETEFIEGSDSSYITKMLISEVTK